MTHEVRVQRVAPARFASRGHCRVGAAKVEITPHAGLAMAGYSTDGKRARGVASPLQARAIAFEDARGERAALCVIDLMSASRYLLERVAATTARSCGIAVGQLVLTGTHTHTGPGHFYGNALYDHLAQCDSGFDEALANWLADRIATAVTTAFETAQAARIATGVTSVWGVARNASPAAFERNPEAAHWQEPDWPGHEPPADTPSAQTQIDPRLRTLTAVADSTNAPIAVLATFACHNTALGNAYADYSPDWMGHAAAFAEGTLAGHSASPVIVAIAPGPGGDSNALREDLGQGPDLVREVGQTIGRRVVERARRDAPSAEPFDVEIRFRELRLSERRVLDRPDTELAERWYFGVPSLGGGDDSRTILYRLGLARPGRNSRHFPASHAQHPKARAFGPLHDVYRRLKGLDISPLLPVHALRLGRHAWVTIPGEPTVTVGHRIERALLDMSDLADVSVLGYSGDYAGYVTTPEEYAAQHYEGASTLFGRNTASFFQAHLEGLMASPPPPTAPEAASFRTIRAIHRFRAGQGIASGRRSSGKA